MNAVNNNNSLVFHYLLCNACYCLFSVLMTDYRMENKNYLNEKIIPSNKEKKSFKSINLLIDHQKTERNNEKMQCSH